MPRARFLLALLLLLALPGQAMAARNPKVAEMTSHRELALKLKQEGKLAQAEQEIWRAIEAGRMLPNRTPLAEPMLREDLAMIYLDQGRYDEAERELRASLDARARWGKPNDASINVPLNALATSLLRQGKPKEAIPLFQELLKIDTRASGAGSIQMAYSLNNLAAAYMAVNAVPEAEDALQKAYAIGVKAGKAGLGVVANAATNLAAMLKHVGKNDEAEKYYRISVESWTRLRGEGSPQVLLAQSNLGVYYRDRGRYADAQPLLDKVFDTRLALLGPDHPDVALSANNLGWLHAGKEEWGEAGQFFAGAMQTYVDLRNRQSKAALAGKGTTGVSLRELSRPVSGLVGAAYRVAQGQDPKKRASMQELAFESAQWLSQGSAATAQARTSARMAAGTGALSALVREQQDLAAEWTGLNGAVTAALADARTRNTPQVAAARARLAAIDTRLAAIDKELTARFPNYASLADPQPVSIAEIRKWLRPDEALIVYAFFENSTLGNSFVWIVTKDESEAGSIWAALQIQPQDIAYNVARLRCGLDPGAIRTASGQEFCAQFGADGKAGTLAPFEAELAWQLWQSLLGPAAPMLKDKKLLVVTPEPLASLPFQVLVTEQPKAGKPRTGAELKDVAFLGHSHAITVLPSVAGLRAMRAETKASAAPEAYAGFGDPVLTGTRSCARIPVLDTCPTLADAGASTSTTRATRSAGEAAAGLSLKSGIADADAVRLLCPLADTATEIRCVGGSLGAAPASMKIGPEASETALKAMPLDRYRILHFATHGLLAGATQQIADGLAEPALVLTPPAQASALDDGLLTASEVAALKLDADWVVLSACNTAADGGSGETLSGLARAFLYAGSRALLVSHWPVDSAAAVELTTGAFDAMKADPQLGRAEAMRRSMAALIDTGNEVLAHPSYWAPFSVVGEGGVPSK